MCPVPSGPRVSGPQADPPGTREQDKSMRTICTMCIIGGQMSAWEVAPGFLADLRSISEYHLPQDFARHCESS